jgi:hypothetical protein
MRLFFSFGTAHESRKCGVFTNRRTSARFRFVLRAPSAEWITANEDDKIVWL